MKEERVAAGTIRQLVCIKKNITNGVYVGVLSSWIRSHDCIRLESSWKYAGDMKTRYNLIKYFACICKLRKNEWISIFFFDTSRNFLVAVFKYYI